MCWCSYQESGFGCREDVITFNVLYKDLIFVLSIRFAKITLQETVFLFKTNMFHSRQL
jgi:hypothetical protein